MSKFLVDISDDQLGTCLTTKGENEEALKYFNMSIELAESDNSIEITNKIPIYIEACSLYRKLNMYEKAEQLINKALNICQEIYDDKHPLLASIYNDFGILYYSQSKYSKALEYLIKTKEINIERGMFDKYASVCSNIATIYQAIGDMQNYEQYMLEAFNINQKLYDENSLSMIKPYGDIGMLYFDKGEYDKASEYIQKAISIRKNSDGEMHPTLIGLYSFMGGISSRTGNIDDALRWFKLTLDVTKHYYGDEHSRTADSYANVAGINLYKKNYDEAIALLKEALRIHTTIHGEVHTDVASDYNGIAQTYMAMGNYQDAIFNFEKAIEIRKKVFGENSVKLKSLYGFMIEIYQKLGDKKKADSYNKLLDAIQK